MLSPSPCKHCESGAERESELEIVASVIVSASKIDAVVEAIFQTRIVSPADGSRRGSEKSAS